MTGLIRSTVSWRPEIEWRKRVVLPADKALKMLSDPELADCVKRLVARLQR